MAEDAAPSLKEFIDKWGITSVSRDKVLIDESGNEYYVNSWTSTPDKEPAFELFDIKKNKVLRNQGLGMIERWTVVGKEQSTKAAKKAIEKAKEAGWEVTKEKKGKGKKTEPAPAPAPTPSPPAHTAEDLLGEGWGEMKVIDKDAQRAMTKAEKEKAIEVEVADNRDVESWKTDVVRLRDGRPTIDIRVEALELINNNKKKYLAPIQSLSTNNFNRYIHIGALVSHLYPNKRPRDLKVITSIDVLKKEPRYSVVSILEGDKRTLNTVSNAEFTKEYALINSQILSKTYEKEQKLPSPPRKITGERKEVQKELREYIFPKYQPKSNEFIVYTYENNRPYQFLDSFGNKGYACTVGAPTIANPDVINISFLKENPDWGPWWYSPHNITLRNEKFDPENTPNPDGTNGPVCVVDRKKIQELGTRALIECLINPGDPIRIWPPSKHADLREIIKGRIEGKIEEKIKEKAPPAKIPPPPPTPTPTPRGRVIEKVEGVVDREREIARQTFGDQLIEEQKNLLKTACMHIMMNRAFSETDAVNICEEKYGALIKEMAEEIVRVSFEFGKQSPEARSVRERAKEKLTAQIIRDYPKEEEEKEASARELSLDAINAEIRDMQAKLNELIGLRMQITTEQIRKTVEQKRQETGAYLTKEEVDAMVRGAAKTKFVHEGKVGRTAEESVRLQVDEAIDRGLTRRGFGPRTQDIPGPEDPDICVEWGKYTTHIIKHCGDKKREEVFKLPTAEAIKRGYRGYESQ